MRVVPVLDLLNGVVVRGVAGKRSEYRPVVSGLVGKSEPLAVARAFRSELGLDTLYVADLDAIVRGKPNWETYRQLADDGFALWIDAGLRNPETATALLAAGAETAIVGLETWPSPELLGVLCRSVGPDHVIFSLDLQAGRPLGDYVAWPGEDPIRIAGVAAAAGIRRFIVLDLAAVGVNDGVGTLDLCRCLHEQNPEWELTTGGGVRHGADLIALSLSDIDAVLIASALHDGRVTRADIERVSGGRRGRTIPTASETAVQSASLPRKDSAD